MSRLPILSAREVIRKLARAGFIFSGARGSHQGYQHPATLRKTVVPVHGRGDIGRPLLKKILEQAGISIDEFLRL